MNEKERDLMDAVGLKPCPVIARWPLTIALGRGSSLPALIAGLVIFAVSFPHGIATATIAAALAGTLLVVSLAAHECGHLLFVRNVEGITPRIMVLRATGGVSIVEGRFEDARGAAMFASGGPLVTLTAAVALAVAGFALAGPFREALLLPALVNALILLVNLAPVAPTDGYMLVRSALWARMGNRAEAEWQALAWSRNVLGCGAVASLLVFAYSQRVGALGYFLLLTLVIQHHLVFRRVATARRSASLAGHGSRMAKPPAAPA